MTSLLLALLLLMGCVLQPTGEDEASTSEQNQENAAAATAASPAATPAAEAPAASPTVASASQASRAQFSGAPAMTIDPSANYTADFRTNYGNFQVELLASQTPITVNNFVFLAQQGFYDGLIFHRVIENFMIQGGDPTGTGAGGPGYQFQDEIVAGLVFDEPGKLAMANAGPNTNGSQFFITTAATGWLNGAHTIFGTVTEGQAVVDAISRVATGARDAPLQRVIIERIDIIQAASQ